MAKYKVKHTKIMHNGSLAKEGDIIELTDEQAKRLADFVDVVPEIKKPETKTTNTNKANTSKNTKAKTETKTATKSETISSDNSNGTVEKGGTDGK